MLSITVDGLQVDNQLPSALFPALLRPRPLPQARRLPDGSKAPVGLIQLDGLAPRPADRPPALHFFAKRRASDSSHTAGGGSATAASGGAPAAAAAAAAKRASLSAGPQGGGSSPRGGGEGAGGAVDGVGGAGGVGGLSSQEEELDMVVYYYDVTTIWIRPVDLKVMPLFRVCFLTYSCAVAAISDYTSGGADSEKPGATARVLLCALRSGLGLPCLSREKLA